MESANESFLKLFNLDFVNADGAGWINKVHNLDIEKVRQHISNGIEGRNREVEFLFKLAETKNQYRARILIHRNEKKHIDFIVGTISNS